MRIWSQLRQFWRIMALGSTLACLFVVAGCRPAAKTVDSASAVDRTPKDVLLAMVEAYRSAVAYSDQGVLRLTYEQKGMRFQDQVPLTVATEAGDRLYVRAYQATIVCDGNKLLARVADPNKDEMGRQALLLPAPSKLSLDSLLTDPILQSAVTGGGGRLPIQLELLFGENPLSVVLADTVEKRFLPATRIQGHPCHVVEVTTDEGRFAFWIDQETSILRQLKYPSEIVPAEMGEVPPNLVAEFRQAQFGTAIAESTFLVSIGPDDQPVSAFVVPPAPLASPLLGKSVTDFHFLNPTGNSLTAKSLAGRIVVLLWFNDHPASQSALQQLETVRGAVDPAHIAIIAVCAESSQRSDQDVAEMMRQWGVQVPMVRDYRANGRDLFKLTGAPALVVLDAHGVVQVYQVGANPNLANELHDILIRIARGVDLATESHLQYDAEMAAFRAAFQ